MGLFGGDLPVWGIVFVAMAGSFAVGIAVSRLVEWPMFALRDRVFPSFVQRYFEARTREK